MPGSRDRAERRADKSRREALRAHGIVVTTTRRMRRLADASGGKVLVGLSGGKDSLVILDLCCRYIPQVEAYYMYLVPGLETFEAPVDAAALRHGVKVHKVPHWDVARLIRYAVLRPHVRGAEEIRLVKLSDVEASLRAQTGIDWVVLGERANDSYMRRFYTRVDDGVQTGPRKAYPVWDWLDADVYAYLRHRNITIPSVDPGFIKNRSSGFTLTGKSLSALHRLHKADYQRVLRTFPYAEAERIKYEAGLRASSDEVPSVQDHADSPVGDPQRAVQPSQD